jgi:FkbM family methyltransferase
MRPRIKPKRLAITQRICRSLPPIIGPKVRKWVYPDETARRDDYEFVVRSQTGSRFMGRTSDFHSYRFSVHGFYDWRNWAVALACCSEGDTVIEIGANVGTETIGFADIVGKAGSVHAFEPLPANLEALRKVVELCGSERSIHIHSLAVSDSAGKVRFVVPPAHSSGTGHLLHQNGAVSSQLVEVDAVTLDSLAGDIGPCRLIVIDTEGEEIRVLRGARRYIEQFRPILVLEASPAHLRRNGFQLGDLWTELRSNGYSCYRITRLGLTHSAITTHPHPSNWVCFHDSSPDLVKSISAYIKRCGLLPCIRGLNPMTMQSAM